MEAPTTAAATVASRLRRLVEGNAVHIQRKEGESSCVTDPLAAVHEELILKLGKRRFVRIVPQR